MLEPVGANPVIIEDEVLVGGNCGVYEGTIVRRRAVLAAGVVLTASTRVYDVVNGRILTASAGTALEIPAVALLLESIDTDQLIPARFLRKSRDQGYGRFLLHDLEGFIPVGRRALPAASTTAAPRCPPLSLAAPRRGSGRSAASPPRPRAA